MSQLQEQLSVHRRLTIDADVVRRVGKDDVASLFAHQGRVARFLSGIAAQQYMPTHLPYIAGSANGCRGDGRDCVFRRVGTLPFLERIEVDCVEPRNFDIEIKIKVAELRQLYA